MKWVIYTLKDPRSEEIRYVGFTKRDPAVRMRYHLRDTGTTYRHRWINSLLAVGVSPVMQLVHRGDGPGWQEAERAWISFFRNFGCRLVNSTEGGEGLVGWGTKEQRSARRAKGVASTTPEQRSEAARKGFANRSPEAKSAGGKAAAKTMTEERREHQRLMARRRFQAMTPEQRREFMEKAFNTKRSFEDRSRASKLAHSRMSNGAKSWV